MATKITLPLTLFLLVLGCSAQSWPWQTRHHQPHHQHHQQQQQFQQCDIQRLTASEPSRRVKSEAGITEIWDRNTPEFRCTGFVAIRVVIQPGGLLLPSYTNAPYLTFVEQGKGVQGVIVPGCPNTFQSSSSSSDESESEYSRRGRDSEERDQHQKVFRVREGDVIPSPAGVVQWTHNDGETDLISITLIDSNNFQNQLHHNVKSFFLAGQNQKQSRRQSEDESDRDDESLFGGNVLSGFDEEILREIFRGADKETISKIQGESDERGFIVRARDLKVRVPEETRQEEELQRQRERRSHRNGVEQSLCNLKFKLNIDGPAHAAVFNPRAGRINTINSNSLPILQHLRLSAEHVTLYKGAIIGPRWSLNAHSAVYVTRGEGRAQVVGDGGKTVFDEVVQKGQILVIPQGFAVVVKAGKEGVEWVDVKTNDDAIMSPIAGKTSVLRAIPAEVLSNAYGISREQALRLKNGREEVEVFRPFQSRAERQRERFSIV